ncbi:unnamed protein product [Thlaspi arvense]|uniref:Uncharacterized protein n=1 Tax=Thlaspi arvense TaxID=13288 RepID=A0AAU9TEM7_THLAR|nr:unnamed protein product [Thlaspi arvense]
MGSLKQDDELENGMEESKEAILYVNGVRRVLPDGLAHMTLLEYLRGKFTPALGSISKRKVQIVPRKNGKDRNFTFITVEQTNGKCKGTGARRENEVMYSGTFNFALFLLFDVHDCLS